VSVADADVY